MKSANRYDGIDAYIVAQIRYHASRLRRHHSIHRMEVEDIEQELLLALLSKLHAYDPKKSYWRTFIDRILNHKIADLIVAAKTQKRGKGLPPISLDAMLECEDYSFPDSSGNPEHRLHLLIDLNRVAQVLPPSLLHLMLQQGVYNNISELSRMIPMPRSRLHMLIQTLRMTLRKKGMYDYLT